MEVRKLTRVEQRVVMEDVPVFDITGLSGEQIAFIAACLGTCNSFAKGSRGGVGVFDRIIEAVEDNGLAVEYRREYQAQGEYRDSRVLVRTAAPDKHSVVVELAYDGIVMQDYEWMIRFLNDALKEAERTQTFAGWAFETVKALRVVRGEGEQQD